MNITLRVVNKYLFLASKYPFFTNAVTGFMIATVGDFICQKYFERRKVTENAKPCDEFDWNVRRSLEMGLIRASVITPFIHFWYPFLVRVSPGATLFRVFERVVVDQLFGSPFVICMVFIANAALHGELSAVVHRIRHQFLDTWFTGLRYWPIVHSITFSVIPLVHRSLFAHFASIYWMAILSYHSNARTVGDTVREK